MRHVFTRSSAITAAAAAKLCVASAQSNAAIIYTDIADVTFNDTVKDSISVGSSFDIDSNGFADISVFHTIASSGSENTLAESVANGLNGSLLISDDNGPFDSNKYFATGDLISGVDREDFGTLARYDGDSGSAKGEFLNISDDESVVSGYLGFELASGNLGWMELDVAGANLDGPFLEANSLAITVKSYAYEDSGQAIRAGQTVNAVPVPATWALLALGAFAGLATRRKRLAQ